MSILILINEYELIFIFYNITQFRVFLNSATPFKKNNLKY